MAESLTHMKYVEHMVIYAQQIPNHFSSSMMHADLPQYNQQTPQVIDGYYPDLFYYDLESVIIGEAKTERDIDNPHTLAQLNSYIKEVRTYTGNKHIILCTSVSSYAQLHNLIVRKKKKEQIQDITFHILDNHLRSKEI